MTVSFYVCVEIGAVFMAADYPWRGPRPTHGLVLSTTGPPLPIGEPPGDPPQVTFRYRLFRHRLLSLPEPSEEHPVTAARRLLAKECGGSPRYLPVDG